jgi:hypothetical protein
MFCFFLWLLQEMDLKGSNELKPKLREWWHSWAQGSSQPFLFCRQEVTLSTELMGRSWRWSKSLLNRDAEELLVMVKIALGRRSWGGLGDYWGHFWTRMLKRFWQWLISLPGWVAREVSAMAEIAFGQGIHFLKVFHHHSSEQGYLCCARSWDTLQTHFGCRWKFRSRGEEMKCFTTSILSKLWT